MNTLLLRRIKAHIQKIPQVKLAYLFGSRARGDSVPMSDHDFAFYLDDRRPKEAFRIQCHLANIISRELGSDHFDVVILDTLDATELKYRIVQEGKLFFEREPYRIVVEPLIMMEYEDFHNSLVRFGQTKAPLIV